ncbi:cytochrome c-type biogenesis protein CcmE [Desulfovibrionales bacterium]
MSKQGSKGVYIAAFMLLAAGLGYLVFSGISSDSVYFVNVAEALAMPAEKLTSARLFGTVDGQKIILLQDQRGIRFRLIDKDDVNKSLWVEYQGTVPNTFKDGAEVIVEGSLPKSTKAQDNQAFKATVLMTKCPSKYQKKNRVP